MTTGTRRGRWAIAIALALTLAACSNGATEDTGSTTTTTAVETTAAGETTTTTASTDTTAGSEEPIVLGVSYPLSGGAAALGESAMRGAELYLNAVNDGGGIDGRPIELLVQDNACTPADGVTAMSALVDAATKPVAILGAFCSSSTIAALPVIERGEIPLLVDAAAAPIITESGNPWVFRWGGSDAVFARVMASYLVNETDIRRVALVGDNTDYGSGGIEAAKAAIANHPELEIVSEDLVDLNSPDFTPMWRRIGASEPDAVWLHSVAVAGTLTLLDQYGQTNLASIPIVGRPNNDNATLEVFEQYGLNGYSAFHYAVEVDSTRNAEFIAEWVAAYGSTDGAAIGYFGYQGAEVAVTALRQADSIDPEGIRAALENMSLSPTLLGGSIEFNEKNQASNHVVLFQFDGSTLDVVFVGTAD